MLSAVGFLQLRLQDILPPPDGSAEIDPRVKSICTDFGITGDTVMRHKLCKLQTLEVDGSCDSSVTRLNDAMREREDYDEDLQALHKLMDRATKDT